MDNTYLLMHNGMTPNVSSRTEKRPSQKVELNHQTGLEIQETIPAELNWDPPNLRIVGNIKCSADTVTSFPQASWGECYRILSPGKLGTMDVKLMDVVMCNVKESQEGSSEEITKNWASITGGGTSNANVESYTDGNLPIYQNQGKFGDSGCHIATAVTDNAPSDGSILTEKAILEYIRRYIGNDSLYHGVVKTSTCMIQEIVTIDTFEYEAFLRDIRIIPKTSYGTADKTMVLYLNDNPIDWFTATLTPGNVYFFNVMKYTGIAGGVISLRVFNYTEGSAEITMDYTTSDKRDFLYTAQLQANAAQSAPYTFSVNGIIRECRLMVESDFPASTAIELYAGTKLIAVWNPEPVTPGQQVWGYLEGTDGGHIEVTQIDPDLAPLIHIEGDGRITIDAEIDRVLNFYVDEHGKLIEATGGKNQIIVFRLNEPVSRLTKMYAKISGYTSGSAVIMVDYAEQK